MAVNTPTLRSIRPGKRCEHCLHGAVRERLRHAGTWRQVWVTLCRYSSCLTAEMRLEAEFKEEDTK